MLKIHFQAEYNFCNIHFLEPWKKVIEILTKPAKSSRYQNLLKDFLYQYQCRGINTYTFLSHKNQF